MPPSNTNLKPTKFSTMEKNESHSMQMIDAQRTFRRVVKSELNRLLKQGVEREAAVLTLLKRIVECTEEPSPKDVDDVMKQFKMNKEDAIRALIVKQELGRLKRRGLDPLAAIEDLTMKMQGMKPMTQAILDEDILLQEEHQSSHVGCSTTDIIVASNEDDDDDEDEEKPQFHSHGESPASTQPCASDVFDAVQQKRPSLSSKPTCTNGSSTNTPLSKLHTTITSNINNKVLRSPMKKTKRSPDSIHKKRPLQANANEENTSNASVLWNGNLSTKKKKLRLNVICEKEEKVVIANHTKRCRLDAHSDKDMEKEKKKLKK